LADSERDILPARGEASPGPGFAPQTGASDRAARFRASVHNHVLYTCVRWPEHASAPELYRALASAVRDRLVERWLATQATYLEADAKRVCYLSSEFLTGRSLGLCLLNLGLYHEAENMMAERGFDLATVLEQEGDAGLGNGGLGRLAACFMDSLATLELPAVGYGIRYDYGIFEQRIENGEQVEYPDNWLRLGNPWEIPRTEHTQTVRFYGHMETRYGPSGEKREVWVDGTTVQGVPYDSFIVGHETDNVNTLRLWTARAPREFDLQQFNAGDYYRAVAQKIEVENISKVLYPPDHTAEGKELRLKQQYFFVACSLADLIRHFKLRHSNFQELPNKAAVQLNDTHPAIAVAELMRILHDEENVPWEQAWDITRRVFGYTNHTLLPEALEKWSVPLFQKLLPRHLAIIYEINHRFLLEVRERFPDDPARVARMSIIEEGEPRHVRMAHLATVGSHSINGVAKLHSELVKRDLLHDFYEMYPERFNNKTNGVTPRRWLLYANPRLSSLIGDLIGPRFAAFDLGELRRLDGFADDADVLARLREIKHQNKHALLPLVQRLTGEWCDPESVFVVQVKRIHEYKRQLLACLEIVWRYLQMREGHGSGQPRTYLFAGKAAPGYVTAKQHIRLINDVSRTVNSDPSTHGALKSAFLPNYSVSLAQRIFPASDISLQISLAGKEASGTGNMKFALNGAVTLGTLDGANVEIRDSVGEENFLLFGMTVDEVAELRRAGYEPGKHIAQSPRLQAVLEALESDLFSRAETGRYRFISDYLRFSDPFMVCADFDSYVEAHDRADAVYADPHRFSQMSLHNIAGAGVFSSDGTIAAYAREIWGIEPVKVTRDGR
jgi:starch phosphorylase